ncbi:MAG: KH domain-containing protein [Nanoarchaeota archaeon]
MFIEEIKIPNDRIAVLIGKKGTTKKFLENRLGARIKVSSSTGEISLQSDDSLNLFIARQVISAIARGFNPDVAITLLDEQNSFEIINIKDFSKGDIAVARSRVIGTEGRARKYLEQLTDTHIVVYGKTVGIIGPTKNVFIVRRAIENLLRGSKHGNVYAMLEREMKK